MLDPITILVDVLFRLSGNHERMNFLIGGIRLTWFQAQDKSWVRAHRRVWAHWTTFVYLRSGERGKSGTPQAVGEIFKERNIIEMAISLTSETAQEIESIEFDVMLNGG